MQQLLQLIIAVGLPGSGKTTILKPYAAAFGYEYVCLDSIRKDLTGDESDQSQNPEVVARGYAKVAEALHAGRSAIMDATYAKREHRVELITFARGCGAQRVTCLRFKVGLKEALRRNEMRERVVPRHIIFSQNLSLTKMPPSLSEGFDEIIVWE